MVKISVSNKKHVDYAKSVVLEAKLMDYSLSKKVCSKSGKITINYDSKKCKVDLKEKMNSNERLVVLKKIFYEFCLLYEENKDKSKCENIDQFTFIDVRNDEDYDNPKSLIENLMYYDVKLFDEENEEEKILANVIKLCNDIGKKVKKGIKQIGLPILTDNMTENEEKLCHEIIIRYFSSFGYDVKMVSRLGI